jgi:hypothetical protein
MTHSGHHGPLDTSFPLEDMVDTAEQPSRIRSAAVEHQGAGQLAEILLTEVIWTCPLLYLEALAFITREPRDAAACRVRGRTCFLGERSSIDLPEHDVERAEDRRDVGKHVPAAQEVHRL